VRTRVLFTVLVAATVGCIDPTSILLVVDGDLEPGVELDALAVYVSIEGTEVWSMTHRLSAQDQFPQTLRVVPGSRISRAFDLEVTARLDGGDVVTAVRSCSFVEHRQVEERVCLWRRCAGSPHQSCLEGRCEVGDGDADADGDVEDGDVDRDADLDADGDHDAGDTRAPVTTAAPVGATRSCPVDVVLTADEPGCTTHFTSDGSDPRTSSTASSYSGPITVEETTTLRFYSVDPAGNREAARTEVYERADPGTVLRSYAIPGSGQIYGVAFDGTSLWISDWDTNVVSEMDPHTGDVLGSFPVGSPDGISGLAWDGSTLWINTTGRTVHQYTTDGTELGSCDTGVSSLMGATFAGDRFAFSSDSQSLANEMDVTSCEIVDSFPVAWGDDGLTWDGEAYWSTDWSGDVIYRLSPVDRSIERTIPAPGHNPAGLQWDGTYLWCCSWADQLIYQIVP